MTLWKSIQKTLAALAITAGLAGAQVSPGAAGDVRQSLNDAWFTGPMLAPSASTLPRGHLLIQKRDEACEDRRAHRGPVDSKNSGIAGAKSVDTASGRTNQVAHVL